MKKIAILGAGESGVGAAVLAKKQGSDVFVSDFGEIQNHYKKILDDNKIAYEEKKHSEQKILSASEIIKSPGIPDTVPILKKAIEKGIKIISEIEFAGRYTNAKTICITGSNGKTTTTTLIYEIFKSAGINVGLGGNVGQSFAMQVATENFSVYVLELSSFQLDNMYEFKADVSIILNITPDHLDRYNNDFQQYINSKFRIIQNQTKDDFFIYFNDDENILKEISKRKIKPKMLPFSTENEIDTDGAFMKNDTVTIKINSKKMQIATSDIKIKGKHNVQNSMAAYLAAEIYGITSHKIRKKLESFDGVEHRLEKYLTIRGVTFINDSKATNINSTWYALESMKTDTVLILGGIDKGNDYKVLEPLVRQKVKTIVALGTDNRLIKNFFRNKIEVVETKSMEEAVKSAYLLADKGDTVLLSPACASFDLFRNYTDRGRKFKEAVRNL